ncbi:MAG: universal stress protein [Thermoleophilaceae bacterium]
MAFRRILVSYDASPDGDEALFMAAEVARKSAAELVVAATAPVEPVRYVGLAMANTWNRLVREDARMLLDRAALLLEDLQTPRRVVLEGSRRTALAECAEKLDCDLVVLPAPPRGPLALLLTRDPERAIVKRGRAILRAPAARARRDRRRRAPSGSPSEA